MTDLKVAEGESPIPLDRVFYRYEFLDQFNFRFSFLSVGNH